MAWATRPLWEKSQAGGGCRSLSATVCPLYRQLKRHMCTRVGCRGSPHGSARSAPPAAVCTLPAVSVSAQSHQCVSRTALSGSAQPARQKCFGARRTPAVWWRPSIAAPCPGYPGGGGEEAFLSGRMSRQSGLKKKSRTEPCNRRAGGPYGGTYPVWPGIWWGDLHSCRPPSVIELIGQDREGGWEKSPL